MDQLVILLSTPSKFESVTSLEIHHHQQHLDKPLNKQPLSQIRLRLQLEVGGTVYIEQYTVMYLWQTKSRM
ncbi:hypothetical protein PAAG_11229 [Paracoccidioides lutzii Pb01]|uniref:Uncharacterized protein n=1 Tax=Paracoccidioides lutzii (strain ATCC MYA-826 / Pb01) TaxID=502779 RepID=A0A0A2V3I2_PARBA|nr:hypothetical protein PAAG_11229 [Paracoccidioides lutzii Pb01]KGQ02048.1 hypothetical protein PAAG_11229 [Paracoccidioides lutzii Pb01]